jgi:quinol monooxygenase YgiN
VAVISVLDLHFDPARIDAALAAAHETLAHTRAFAGSLGVEVTQDPDDPGHVQFVERWESIDNDRAYRAWRASADAPPNVIGAFEVGPRQLMVGEIRAGV